MAKLPLLVLLALPLALAADSLHAQRVNVGRGLLPPAVIALPVHVGGRVHVSSLGARDGGSAYRHQWPGIYFEAAFTGSEVFLRFDDAKNKYRLLIDNLPPILIDHPGHADVEISKLPRGKHLLRLEKVTESVSASGSFLGFYAASPEPRPTARARQIEFIGDSAMAGFGNTSGRRECSEEEVRLTTDTQQAFPALSAKHYGADYQINALSGAGVVRNYGGFVPEKTLPSLYPFTLLDKTLRYSDPSWKPQLIILKLQADLVTELRQDERWSSTADLAIDYASSYGRFMQKIHAQNRSATFLVWWFDREAIRNLDTALLLDEMERRLRLAAGAASERLHLLPMRVSNLELSACSGHHNLADHRRITQHLVRSVDELHLSWRSPRR